MPAVIDGIQEVCTRVLVIARTGPRDSGVWCAAEESQWHVPVLPPFRHDRTLAQGDHAFLTPRSTARRQARDILEALAPGSLLAGAHIDIEQPDGQAWCLDCACSVPLIQRGAPCPECGGFWLQANGGTELRILDLQVEDH